MGHALLLIQIQMVLEVCQAVTASVFHSNSFKTTGKGFVLAYQYDLCVSIGLLNTVSHIFSASHITLEIIS